MNHPLLDPHQIIAWDIDNTLVNGPYSDFFCRYILAHPEKEHHIVTFRTGGSHIRRGGSWAEDVYDEVARYGLGREHFTALHSVPDALYHAYAQQRSFYQPALVEEFMNWKGKASAQNGCTVLVDDMIEQVQNGCKLHGVALVDSYDPAFDLSDAL